MSRWHFCNSSQVLCLGSANTRSQKELYASVHPKLVPKRIICLGPTRPGAKKGYMASVVKGIEVIGFI